MKTSKIYLGLAVGLIAFSITLTSCRKKEKTAEVAPDNEQTTATDNNLAESISNDIVAMGSQVCETGTLTTFKTNSNFGGNDLSFLPVCAIVTSSPSIKTYTVDFGTTGCVGTDGRTRTGKLVFNFSASTPTATYYRNPGFSMSITSANYVVDGNQINIINKTVKNTTPATITPAAYPGINLTWSVSANVSIVKASNAGTVSWTCNRTKELINTNENTLCYNGQAYPINWTKAKIKINGTATGTNAKGESYNALAKDLVRDFNCAPDITKPHRHPFISGKIEYTPGTRPTRFIDFGNGACDFSGTITINGQSFVFTLQ
ncbi:MAG: hypothetical protein Q7W45_05105 [Bacteroidota bacterium]|nr:hypothetical protein [Bacteroidota bacterium]MDP3144825.1 hypothetical protein [Bacteroidota bacterium]MDP3557804.1 hypothetical protein [Bacteroidota bacterium]